MGSCDSTERGREVAPANTILKMAQKRAHVGTTLNATFTSDRFTADVEDYRGNQSVKSKPEPVNEEAEIGKLAKHSQEDLVGMVNDAMDEYVRQSDPTVVDAFADQAVAEKIIPSKDFTKCTDLQLAKFLVSIRKMLQPAGGSVEFEQTMPSKFDSKCNFCGNKHISKGDEIGLFEGKWGSVNCNPRGGK